MNQGTVFRLSPGGLLTSIFSFNGTNGNGPVAPLIQGSDGNLYGTAQSGGIADPAFGPGTVFRFVMPELPPALNLRRSENKIILSWPTNATGFTLQSAADLNSPNNWIDFTNAPTVVDAGFTITNMVSGSGRFYRLKK